MKLTAAFITALTLVTTSNSCLLAGPDESKQMVTPTDLSIQKGDNSKQMFPPMAIEEPKDVSANHDWSLELGSGVLWSNARSHGEDSYTLIPGTFTAALKIDDVGLDDFAGGVFRGNTEFLFQGFGDALVRSPRGESRALGVNVGPRYNFVQPGWKLVPYVEGLVGLCFADSDAGTNAAGNSQGLGQDFNFTFTVGIGARYDISERWYMSMGAQYTHYSNAGLSEPGHENRPIDSIGPVAAIGFRL